MSKITKLKIKNLFGITEYESDGKNVVLQGKNGVGKTSVIDAIRYALTNKSDRDYIIRSGESEGEIIIEADNGLMIDRKERTTQSQYKSVKQNGLTINSPEAFLRGIFTPLQLSPVEFMAMDKKQQNAIILDMIEYDWSLDTIRGWFGELPPGVNYDQNILAILNDIQAENGEYFMKRQDINRTIREKRAVITDIGASLPPDYDGTKWENESLAELYTEIETIRKGNQMIEKAKALIEQKDNKTRKFQADKEIALAALDREMDSRSHEIDKELIELQNKIKELETEKAGIAEKKADKASVIENEYKANVAAYEAEVESYKEYEGKESTDLTELSDKATNTEKMKAHVNEWRRMKSIQDEVEKLILETNRLTEKIELARTLPGTILETATIPIEGLTVKDGIPLINGLPVNNLSEGEKMDLCIDVAIQNPAGLQIILIDGVEKLATEAREHLYKKCKDKGLQFIATQTTDDETLTVVTLE